MDAASLWSVAFHPRCPFQEEIIYEGSYGYVDAGWVGNRS